MWNKSKSLHKSYFLQQKVCVIHAFLFDLELGFYVIMGCDPPKFILIQQFVENINL